MFRKERAKAAAKIHPATHSHTERIFRVFLCEESPSTYASLAPRKRIRVDGGGGVAPILQRKTLRIHG